MKTSVVKSPLEWDPQVISVMLLSLQFVVETYLSQWKYILILTIYKCKLNQPWHVNELAPPGDRCRGKDLCSRNTELEKEEDLAGFASEFVGANGHSRTGGACAPDLSEERQDGRDAAAPRGEFRAIEYLELETRGLEHDGNTGSLLTRTQ